MKRLATAILSIAALCALIIAGLTSFNALTNQSISAKAQRFTTDRQDGRYNTQSSYCQQLERKLATDWVRGRQSNDTLPKLNKKIRQQDRLFNKFQNKADRMNCYENMFIFGRSLRRTKRCLAIDRKIRSAKKKLAQLQDERSSIKDSRRGGNRRSRLIEELSRNNCGQQYRYEARRSSGNWLEESLGELFGGNYRPRQRSRDEGFSNTIQPYATYRTMCVRLCDGYYFPMSFSTLPSSFPKDFDSCQNNCAAPAELYVYKNPGGEVEQMISPDGRPYDSIKNAWRYRKEYIKGCSCKQTEFSQSDIDAHNNPDKQASNSTATGDSKPVNVEALKPTTKFDKVKTIDDLIR